MESINIGIDVSKETLDLVVLIDGQYHVHDQIKNEKKVLERWIKRLSKELRSKCDEWLLCIEHTGLYCAHIVEVVDKMGLRLWIEDASRIKAFHSLARGKNDELDAERIAEYGYLKRGEAKIWAAPRAVLIELKSLMQLRKRLLTTKHRLCVPVGEEEFMGESSWVKAHKKYLQSILKEVDKKLKEIESRVSFLIKSDKQLDRLYDQVTSVKGVGLVVATTLLIMTNEFKSINDPRKMACHCGVAPFTFSSGKRIRGRTKVSH